MDREPNQRYAVLKPVGHVVVAFPTAAEGEAAAEILDAIGLTGDDVRRYSDREMLAQIDQDLDTTEPVPSLSHELELMRAHRALAARGYHWLVVRAQAGEEAERVAAAVRLHGAERAQLYGHFVIEELLQPRPAVGTSRGAQRTPRAAARKA